jgi:hypothetical protein
MFRDSRVSEHLDTKSVIDLTSSLRHDVSILAKRRPPGRLSNRRAAGRIAPRATSSREPVSLGEVEGVSHASPPRLRKTNARSSRRGKEQISSKISDEVDIIRSDVRVGDNPWNGTRET